MNEGSPADRPSIPTLENMLNKSIFLTSNTNIGQDRKIHCYCGLRLADIHAAGAGTSLALKYAHTHVRNRSRFGINKWYQSFTLRNFDLEDMELEYTNSGSTTKLPILKLGEYEMWAIRIKQYFQIQDYAP
ncbi:hypothetical protein Tco_0432897 [Tanacetum coccineum]